MNEGTAVETGQVVPQTEVPPATSTTESPRVTRSRNRLLGKVVKYTATGLGVVVTAAGCAVNPSNPSTYIPDQVSVPCKPDFLPTGKYVGGKPECAYVGNSASPGNGGKEPAPTKTPDQLIQDTFSGWQSQIKTAGSQWNAGLAALPNIQSNAIACVTQKNMESCKAASKLGTNIKNMVPPDVYKALNKYLDNEIRTRLHKPAAIPKEAIARASQNPAEPTKFKAPGRPSNISQVGPTV